MQSKVSDEKGSGDFAVDGVIGLKDKSLRKKSASSAETPQTTLKPPPFLCHAQMKP